MKPYTERGYCEAQRVWIVTLGICPDRGLLVLQHSLDYIHLHLSGQRHSISSIQKVRISPRKTWLRVWHLILLRDSLLQLIPTLFLERPSWTAWDFLHSTVTLHLSQHLPMLNMCNAQISLSHPQVFINLNLWKQMYDKVCWPPPTEAEWGVYQMARWTTSLRNNNENDDCVQ